ncbi:MAG: rhamnogalacturonan acetylesterase [Prevotella sp.]|nr:rhamnogalacturonan acetylesterase [Prevotella sp.]
MWRIKLIVCCLVALVLTSSTKDKTVTIFMIGDSTMANKDISHDRKERGWGMALQCYFDDHVRIDNHAVNGRSTKSFINEGRWQKVLDRMKPGDYVIIQFGHNDEKPREELHTDPGSTFDYNLARFVREAREHGGIPILMNPVVRRNYFIEAPANDDDEKLRTTTFKDGVKMVEGDSLIDTHGLYRVAPRDVARRMNVLFVDANQLTHDLEQGLGREASKKLHMWFVPGEEPSVPAGRQDNTHYNIYGAHVVARLLADALCEEVPLLSRYRTEADITVDKHGRGQFLSLEKAMESIDPLKPCKIQILGGEWHRPQLPKKSKVEFVLRDGAKFTD